LFDFTASTHQLLQHWLNVKLARISRQQSQKAVHVPCHHRHVAHFSSCKDGLDDAPGMLPLRALCQENAITEDIRTQLRPVRRFTEIVKSNSMYVLMVGRIHGVDDILAQEVLLPCLTQALEVLRVQRLSVTLRERSPTLSVEIVAEQRVRVGISTRFAASRLLLLAKEGNISADSWIENNYCQED
jgi:hypothetical protein